MRIIAVSDIHGHIKTFKKLLENQIQFTKEDKLFLLGDYVHRGPNGEGVFDYILKPLVFDRLKSALDNYREHTKKLVALETQNLNSLDQSTVDQLLPRQNPTVNQPKATSLPKGIDPLTLEKIRSIYGNNDKGHTAEQMGELVGSSRTTARRYLEYLVSTSELIADVSYGSVGRPERLYLKNAL